MNSSLAPICVFAYKRPEFFKQTLKSLSINEEFYESELYIFIDGPSKRDDDSDIIHIEKVKEIALNIKGPKSVTIVKHEENLGLANSLQFGISKVLESNDNIIVIEEDLIVSPYFLNFINTGLNMYNSCEKVISIHGYNYPIQEITNNSFFFLKGADCLGWGTWKRGWDLFNNDGTFLLSELNKRNLSHEFNFYGGINYTGMLEDCISGKNNSWAIKWYASAFLAGKYTLYPGKSLVQHIGIDESATHMAGASIDPPPHQEPIHISRIPIKENLKVKLSIANYFSPHRKIRRKFPYFLIDYIDNKLFRRV